MPYITLKEKQDLTVDETITTVGQLNYIISLEMKKRFMAEFRYHTIHNIRKDFVTNAETCSFLNALHARNRRFTWDDIKTAAALAFMEFYRRIGARYEDKAIKKNGDIYEDILF